MSTDSYCSRWFSAVFYVLNNLSIAHIHDFWYFHANCLWKTITLCQSLKVKWFHLPSSYWISRVSGVLNPNVFLPVMVQQPAGHVSSPRIAGIVHKLSTSVSNMFPCSQHATGRSDLVGIFNACLFSASNIWTISRRAWLCSSKTFHFYF